MVFGEHSDGSRNRPKSLLFALIQTKLGSKCLGIPIEIYSVRSATGSERQDLHIVLVPYYWYPVRISQAVLHLEIGRTGHLAQEGHVSGSHGTLALCNNKQMVL